MSALEFQDYLHHHDVSRDLAWDILQTLRAHEARATMEAVCRT